MTDNLIEENQRLHIEVAELKKQIKELLSRSKPCEVSELQLIRLAESGSDADATRAMKELRDKYDPTYGWCNDCDGLVCKEADCCLNNLETISEEVF